VRLPRAESQTGARLFTEQLKIDSVTKKEAVQDLSWPLAMQHVTRTTRLSPERRKRLGELDPWLSVMGVNLARIDELFAFHAPRDTDGVFWSIILTFPALIDRLDNVSIVGGTQLTTDSRVRVVLQA